jgi:hypothetical protein
VYELFAIMNEAGAAIEGNLFRLYDFPHATIAHLHVLKRYTTRYLNLISQCKFARAQNNNR